MLIISQTCANKIKIGSNNRGTLWIWLKKNHSIITCLVNSIIIVVINGRTTEQAPRNIFYEKTWDGKAFSRNQRNGSYIITEYNKR